VAGGRLRNHPIGRKLSRPLRSAAIQPDHFITRHPDWTEHGHHLAGPLAKTLTDRVLELGWITPAQTRRAVRLTRTGRTGLQEAFGLTIEDRPAHR
jgi:hypothetical protein